MREIIIPDNISPYKVQINGMTYIYPPGTLQAVPDAVAEFIENAKMNAPKERDALPGPVGSVPTVTEQGIEYKKTGKYLPEGGSTGQILRKTADGYEWDDITESKQLYDGTFEINANNVTLANGKVISFAINFNKVVDKNTLTDAEVMAMINHGICGTVTISDNTSIIDWAKRNASGAAHNYTIHNLSATVSDRTLYVDDADLVGKLTVNKSFRLI